MHFTDLTIDESTQIDELLDIWWSWSRAYMEKTGAPRIAVFCKEMKMDDTYTDSDVIDDRINAAIAAQVEAVMESLTWQQKSAIGIITGNRVIGNKVFRNPRMTREELHMHYKSAKVVMWPHLLRRDLVKKEVDV